MSSHPALKSTLIELGKVKTELRALKEERNRATAGLYPKIKAMTARQKDLTEAAKQYMTENSIERVTVTTDMNGESLDTSTVANCSIRRPTKFTVAMLEEALPAYFADRGLDDDTENLITFLSDRYLEPTLYTRTSDLL